MKSNPFLFVALDGLTEKTNQTLNIAATLASSVVGNYGFKVNLDYFLMCGIDSAIKTIRSFGKPIFADLKMWNGTRTMANIVEQLVEAGVDYFNVYSLADEQLPKALQTAKGSHTRSLGVTVLTHYTEDYCRKNFGKSLLEAVDYFARLAIKRGCDGVILPGTALEVVKDLDVMKCVPGLRLPWYPEDSRHEQAVEPKVAIKGGARLLVCGGPVMKAKEKVGIEPAEALKRVLAEMGV